MSQYSPSFLLLPIPEYPALDCAPNKIIKLVVLGGSGVGKTGKSQVCALLFLPSSFAARHTQTREIYLLQLAFLKFIFILFYFFFLRENL